jgi:hypothetical protein
MPATSRRGIVEGPEQRRQYMSPYMAEGSEVRVALPEMISLDHNNTPSLACHIGSATLASWHVDRGCSIAHRSKGFGSGTLDAADEGGCTARTTSSCVEVCMDCAVRAPQLVITSATVVKNLRNST